MALPPSSSPDRSGGQGARRTPDELPICLHIFAHVVRGALCNWWMALAAAHDEPAGAPILRSESAPASSKHDRLESEDAATAASERIPATVPDTVTLEGVEVRDVAAHA